MIELRRGLSDFTLDHDGYRVVDGVAASLGLPTGYMAMPAAVAERVVRRALEQNGTAWRALREVYADFEHRSIEQVRDPRDVLASLARAFSDWGPRRLVLLWRIRKPEVGPPPEFRVPPLRYTPEPIKEDTLHHFELQLLDQRDEPYPRISLEIEDPEGKLHAARTDRVGYHFLDRLNAGGSCQVRAVDGPDGEAQEGEWVSLALTYHDGSPVPGAAYVATPSGGAAIEGTLDESGCATLAGVAGGCTVRFPQLDTPSDELVAGVDLAPKQVTHLVANRPVLCHRVTGFLFETDKSFLLPECLPAMAEIRSDYEQHPGYEVHVVGHTDTTGSNDYNRTLSKERAEAMAAFLRDDRGAWLAWYGAGKPEKKRWGRREDLLMISALPDGASLSALADPVAAYRKARQMGAGGADDAMRRKLIEEYMAIDQTPLPAGTKLVTEGKGEDEPLIASGDGKAEAQNRRVEVLFCPPGKPRPPKPKPKKETPVAPTPKGALRELRLIDTEGENESQLREVIQNEILEVVPSPQKGSNRIEVRTTVEPPVVSEAVWAVTGGATKSGASAFIVTAPPGSGWNPKAQPRVHVVQAEVADMNQMAATVHVYPNAEFSAALDFDKPAPWKDVVEKIEKVIDFVGGEFKLKLPRGKWSIKARFREHHDRRAFYWFELIAHLKPLIEFEQAKLTLGPDKVLKLAKKIIKHLPGKLGKKLEELLEKAVQVHGYVSIAGTSALDVVMVRTSPGQALHSVQNQGEGITGTPILRLGIKLGLGDDPKDEKDTPLVNLEGFGTASFPVTADVFVDEKGWGIELSVKMSELTIEGTAQVWKMTPEKFKAVVMEAPEQPVYGPKKFYLAEF